MFHNMSTTKAQLDTRRIRGYRSQKIQVITKIFRSIMLNKNFKCTCNHTVSQIIFMALIIHGSVINHINYFLISDFVYKIFRHMKTTKITCYYGKVLYWSNFNAL